MRLILKSFFFDQTGCQCPAKGRMVLCIWSGQVCIYTGCIFANVQISFYIYAIAFTCPKIHPGTNYTYMYNLHIVCKSAHVNGVLATTL